MPDAAPAPSTDGSLWNQGNWHWESKSFGKGAEADVRQRLLSIELEGGGVVVKVAQVLKLSVEAALHARRGKRIATFDISCTLRWEGWGAGGGGRPATTPSGKQAAGEAIFTDVMQDDVDSDFAVNVYMSSISGHNAVDARSKDVAKAGLPVAVREQLRAFHATLVEMGARADAAATDTTRRQAEAQKTAAAQADVGAVAERARLAVVQADRLVQGAPALIAALNKEKQQQQAGGSDSGTRAAAAEQPQVDEHVLSLPVPLKVEAAGAAPEVRPSDWNAGAWSWETRDLSAWSRIKLHELLSHIEFDVPPLPGRQGAFLKTIEPDGLKVDASVSIRKNKTLLLFEISCELPWEGSLVSPDGRVLGQGDGLVRVLDLDQDSVLEGDYTCAAGADAEGGEQDDALARIMQQHGVPLLRAKFRAYAQELSSQALALTKAEAAQAGIVS